MSEFIDKLKQVAEFFKPENLEKQAIKYDAILVIDVQKEFCDPNRPRGNEETEVVSKRIKSLIPEFRNAGVPVYAIYFDRDKRKKEISEIDFYEFEPHPDDMLVAKNDDSAFRGSDIKALLEKDGKKNLLMCGFNTSACVMSTVLDARRAGFDVTLLRDLTGNDNCNPRNPGKDLRHMESNGMKLVGSDTALEQLRLCNTLARPAML